MRVFATFITLTLLLQLNCYNNAHLRTQKRLEDGEKVNSLTGSLTIGGPSQFNKGSTGIPGCRMEGSILKGDGKGEKGLYIGGGIGDIGIGYLIGYEKKKYIKSGKNTPYKIGLQSEINYSSGFESSGRTIAVQLRPSIISIVTDNRTIYHGIHGLCSYGDIITTEYYDYGYDAYENTNKYKSTNLGIGFTIGTEKLTKSSSLQFQFDISLLKNYFTDKSLKQNISLLVSTSIGMNRFFSPLKKKKEKIQKYDFYLNNEYEKQKLLESKKMKFDPETGKFISGEKPDTTKFLFDPNTGKLIKPDRMIIKDTTSIRFDPNTGEIIKDSTVSTCDTSKLNSDIQEKAEENEYIFDPTTGKLVKKSETVLQITEAQVIMKAKNDAKNNHSQIVNVGCGAGGCLYPLLGIPAGILYAESNIFSTIDLESAYVQQLNPDLRKRYIKTYKVEQRRLRRSAVYGTQVAISIAALILILTLI